MSNNIKVICRLRPPNASEIAEYGSESVVDIDSDGKTISLKAADSSEPAVFTYDKAFDIASQQQEVFEYGVRDIVTDVMNGYNGTVFAYGQTGSGKSHTMMGPDIDDATLKGIIPRITEHIFQSILSSPPHLEYVVKVSYMEIYMEKIKDLLAPQNDNLPIHENKQKGVYVKNLTEVYVSSQAEVFDVMKQGSLYRAVSSTAMNADSSRSHAIFVLSVQQRNTETDSSKTGGLFLVDLAGSEKIAKTGATGQTLEEAKKINTSLSALGNVINALSEQSDKGAKQRHIPYRDSKLTRILQESLGGNSRTALMVNVSPSVKNAPETLSSLRFGMRAKRITNKARVNAELSVRELRMLLAQSEKQREKLEREMKQLKSGQAVSEKDEGSDTDEPSLENWLLRENELTETIARLENELQDSNGQLTRLRERETTLANENRELSSEVSEMRMQLDRVVYEGREAGIVADALREQNNDISRELEDLRMALEEREKASERDDNGRGSGENSKFEKAQETWKGTLDTLSLADDGDRPLGSAPNIQNGKTDDATTAEEDLKNALEEARAESKQLREAKNELERVLQVTVEGATDSTAEGATSLALVRAQEVERSRAELEAKMTAFERTKKALMTDLQDRCERVVQLEMALHEAQEQYKIAAKAGDTKIQQRKMEFLAQNLSQLTSVQKKLVEQNTQLKKGVSLAEKKLLARSDRIKKLEHALSAAHEKIRVQEKQFEDDMEKLNSRKGPVDFSRIVKPIRGGGEGGVQNDIAKRASEYFKGTTSFFS